MWFNLLGGTRYPVVLDLQPVQLFFPKDSQNHPYPQNAQHDTPNWFYYWRQFLPWGEITQLLFGALAPGEIGDTDVQTKTTTVSQEASEYLSRYGNSGIRTFYQTLIHENEHIAIYEELWPNGYNASKDTDGDGYPDQWELNDPVAQQYHFTIGPPGSKNDIYDSTQPNLAGYRYEEARCDRKVESFDPKIFDSQDWSSEGQQWY